MLRSLMNAKKASASALVLKGVVAAAMVVCAGAASAVNTVIDFSTLGGANYSDFSSYSQFGFTVTSSTGTWSVAQFFGNPSPDIFTNTGGDVTITKNGGGLFGLVGLDTASSAINFGGYLNGNQVFSENHTGYQTGAYQWNTVGSTHSALAIDKLVLSIPQSGLGQNVDNIVLAAAVPEPETYAMMIAGLAGLAFVAKRRKTA